jgi:GNAT superfamily N-acetyltransferase
MPAAISPRQLPDPAFPAGPVPATDTAKPTPTLNQTKFENPAGTFPTGARSAAPALPAPKLESVQKIAPSNVLESIQKRVPAAGHLGNGSVDNAYTIEAAEIRTLIRPTCPADIESVRTFLTGLSVESSYRRFFTGLGRIPDRFVRQLVDVDHERRECLVALAGEDVIALADYALLAGSPQTAELGVVVADAWQRQRLGPYLAGRLLAVAYARGVRQLRAHTLAENARVARLLRRQWPTARPIREDTLLVWHLPLDPPPGVAVPHWPGARTG